jgi:hypothetical protein
MFRFIFKLLRAAIIFAVIAELIKKVVRPWMADRWGNGEETDE